jgi:3-oxoacyl-[acyl-carrier-protein] synthase II
VETRARLLLAGAADEVYAQTFYNYDGIGFLFAGEEEADYRLRPDSDRRKVLGEGAAMLCLETATSATNRNASILAEMLGYGMSMDTEGFLLPNLGTEGLTRAVRLALSRARISAADIGLLVWAPQGNRQDLKVLRAAEEIWGSDFPHLPLVTTTFNTGYIEAASILVSLAAALAALETPGGTSPFGLQTPDLLWPQRTGLPELDGRRLARLPEYLLALASTDLGYNFAAVFRRGWQT